jgi:hypothetical protein
LQHQFVEPENGNEAAIMIFNDFLDSLIGFIGDAVAPEDATFDRLQRLEKPHEAAIVAAIADDDGRVVLENCSQCRLPFVGKFLDFLRLIFG